MPRHGYNPHTDVETLTDTSGDTRATYGYTASGQNDDQSFTGVDKPDPQDPTKQPYNFYRFNAKRFDPSSSTYDMGFRDYDPGLAAFADGKGIVDEHAARAAVTEVTGD